MNEELLILISREDDVIGFEGKTKVHKLALLHRAFSVFIIDEAEQTVLLQRRAKEKYHSGGLWSNSCCSHPRKDESWSHAISRCIEQELGIYVDFSDTNVDAQIQEGEENKKSALRFVGRFEYRSDYSDLSEHELDHVFLWSEVEEMRWIKLSDLEKWCAMRPQEFTSWFKEALNIILNIMVPRNRTADMQKLVNMV